MEDKSPQEYTISLHRFVLNNSKSEILVVELKDLSEMAGETLFVIDIYSDISGLISSSPFVDFNKASEAYARAIEAMKPHIYKTTTSSFNN